MASNIPSSPVAPGVYSSVTTVSRGVSIPNGIRVACLMGEGSRSEVLVSSALGSGQDGLNSSFTSATGADGRHFKLSLFPIISNRIKLFRNGVPLIGLEEVPDTNSFSNRYDYRIDIATGNIELQTASLVDQGGKFYTVSAGNVGLGNLDGYGGPDLVDLNAPSETWTVKCVSVQRNNLNQPIQDTARFIALGSVSGVRTDANGNPVVWVADGQRVSNGIIRFAINETKVGPTSTTPFREGDSFTIQVKSGALIKNDTLTATYIAETDLNDPQFFTSAEQLQAKHGAASLDNTLSLGAQLAFANSPPGVLAIQTKPSLPRRTSYQVATNFDATSTTLDDYTLPLPLGVRVEPTSNINFFVTNPTTGEETQILPNKYSFFTLGTGGGNPTVSQFVFSVTNPPAGYAFSYSVIEDVANLNAGSDGYLNRSLTSSTLATFSLPDTVFDSSYIGKNVKIFDATNLANNGTFEVTSVVGGQLVLTAGDTPPFADFVNDTGVDFEVINPVTGAVVPASSGTDGVLTANPSTAQGTFSSTAVNFTALPTLTGLKLRIIDSATATNEGLFDILSVDGGDTLTIAKSFVSEDDLQYEIQDPSDVSQYIVVNQSVIPNGNSLRVTLVDVKDASFYDSGWADALEKLETVDLDILVPLPKQTSSVIFQAALTHCQVMSNIRNRRERVLFTGAIKGLAVENLTGAEPAAVEDIGVLEGIQGDSVLEVLSGNTEDLTNYSVPDSFGSTFRCTYFYPDEIVVTVGASNVKVDGFYIAAAAAAYVAGTPNIAMPLTNKVLTGFTILRDKTLSPTAIDSLMNVGVAVLQPVAGGGRVLWGRTTTQSGFVEEEELSIVFIRDRVAKNLRAGFTGFIGTPEDADTITVLTARANGLLKGFISQKLITDYTGLTVRRDDVNPTQWNVSVACVPSYGINFIYVKVNLGLI